MKGVTMDCESVLRSLPAYVDQIIPAEDADLIDSHLEVCAACRHEHTLYEAVETILLDEPLRSVPHRFVDRIMARVARQKAMMQAPGREFRWATLIAASLAIVVGTANLLLSSSEAGANGLLHHASWLTTKISSGLTHGMTYIKAMTQQPQSITDETSFILGAILLLAMTLVALRLKLEPTVNSEHNHTKDKRGS